MASIRMISCSLQHLKLLSYSQRKTWQQTSPIAHCRGRLIVSTISPLLWHRFMPDHQPRDRGPHRGYHDNFPLPRLHWLISRRLFRDWVSTAPLHDLQVSKVFHSPYSNGYYVVDSLIDSYLLRGTWIPGYISSDLLWRN